MRIFLQYILPLAFPTALYLLWALYHKKNPKSDRHIDLTKGPYARLILTGLALTTVGLVIFNQLDSEKAGGTYQPPVLKDGKVIPGHVIRDE